MGMMGLHEGRPEKQVRLTVLDNEPMSRLAEQRLRQAGIPCYISPLGVGPGGWGSAYNLPHALYVHHADVTRARELLELVPGEMAPREGAGPARRRPAQRLAAVAIIAAWLAAGAIAFLVARIAG